MNLVQTAQQRPPAYLSLLNNTQQEIAKTTEGSLLVLAGAGTGKTKTLTTRVAHILTLALAQPDEILCVTFTNKAANEMRQRIEALIGSNVANMPWLGTFHGLGAKFLRRHATAVNLTNNFDIIDKKDAEKLIKKLIGEHEIEDKTTIIKNIWHNIERWKGQAVLPAETSQAEYIGLKDETLQDTVMASDKQFLAREFAQAIYKKYQAMLQKLDLCDFGDLLMYPVKILQRNAEILAYYQQKLRYIMVDEYQDTNLAQYLFLRLLAQKSDSAPANICCVGDDDQSIYGWRGANVEHMLRFTTDFPGAKIIKLERNYRSQAHILDTANKLIANNSQRLGKLLYPDKKEKNGAKIYKYHAIDSLAEADMVSSLIHALQHSGQKLNDIAVLVRSKALLKSFQLEFQNANIECRLIGETAIHNKSEVKDLLAYLRLVAQPNNDLAFERIINMPRRGLGNVTMQKIRDYGLTHNLSLFESLQRLLEAKAFSKKLQQALEYFTSRFAKWQKQASNQKIDELAESILSESGYRHMLEQKGQDGQEKLETLKALIYSMEYYSDLQAYLEKIALETEKSESPNRDAVNLMTMHAAKGLEFDTVLLPGWEEGMFPAFHHDDIEEERRLAYVAITRAKKDVYIFSAARRRTYTDFLATGGPSRFVKELPAELLQEMLSIPITRRKTKSPAIPIHRHKFQPSERVYNIKFGQGTVIDADKERLKIAFDNGETRVIVASFISRLND